MVHNFVKILAIVLLAVLLFTVFSALPGIQQQNSVKQSGTQVKIGNPWLTGTVANIFDNSGSVALLLINNNAEINSSTVRSDISYDSGINEPSYREASVLYRQINRGLFLTPLYLTNKVLLN